VTVNVPDPENEGQVIENEILETTPMVIESLEKEGFRAVSVAAGDSVSVAVSDKGEIRAWGSFRVRIRSLSAGRRYSQSGKRRCPRI
jgi:regulator of chromosome condensation